MLNVIAAIQEVFTANYNEIAQQKLKRYRFNFSSTQRLRFYSFLSLGVLACAFLIFCFTQPVTRILINHTECTSRECRYTFSVGTPLNKHTYLYGIVKGAAQTHMKYSPDDDSKLIDKIASKMTNQDGQEEDVQKIEECRPYIENGVWMYPCGVLMSTYPFDKYSILTQQNKEVPMVSDRKSQIKSWMSPSSFSSAKYKIGEIEGLQPGEYTLLVKKQTEHPLPERSLLLVGNIGVFGTIFSNAGIYIIITVVLLAVVNAVACAYYV
ncbi:hypothetical protein NEMIN01_1548 [Nematocida minor]|uniref:uncharacterized protein n=1 Tax=Nematocida minor TaxID=1912983 RepID=UPI00221F87CE|nr:uncharacterized protein NEMIN01_1548 [Nematocida minor]KAI5191522.1 hypothetical protein NEMIN01_1548 [Nematocida minor]